MSVRITLNDGSIRQIPDRAEGKVVAEYRQPIDLLIISVHPTDGEPEVIETMHGHQYRAFKND